MSLRLIGTAPSDAMPSLNHDGATAGGCPKLFCHFATMHETFECRDRARRASLLTANAPATYFRSLRGSHSQDQPVAGVSLDSLFWANGLDAGSDVRRIDFVAIRVRALATIEAALESAE